MAVKIRLRRMGQKKAPFYRIIVLIPVLQETENSSRKSVLTIRQKIQANSKLMKKQQKNG